jgi:hypothetical protein
MSQELISNHTLLCARSLDRKLKLNEEEEKQDLVQWGLILDSRAPKNKLEVCMRLVQVVHNRSQKMNMKKIETKNKNFKICEKYYLVL